MSQWNLPCLYQIQAMLLQQQDHLYPPVSRVQVWKRIWRQKHQPTLMQQRLVVFSLKLVLIRFHLNIMLTSFRYWPGHWCSWFVVCITSSLPDLFFYWFWGFFRLDSWPGPSSTGWISWFGQVYKSFINNTVLIA